MVTYSLTLPIQDPVVTQFPLEVVSALIQQNGTFMERSIHEKIIITLAPLLEDNHPSAELCNFFALHCRDSPRSAIVLELFAPVVARILKHNMDFGKSPRMRSFVQDYILALKDDPLRLEQFVSSIHGAAGSCPHPRILPNLASICFSAVNKMFDEQLEMRRKQDLEEGQEAEDKENHNYYHCEPWKMMSGASLGSSFGGSSFGGGGTSVGGGGGVSVGGNNNFGHSVISGIQETPADAPVFEFLTGVPLAPSSAANNAAPPLVDVIVEEPAPRHDGGGVVNGVHGVNGVVESGINAGEAENEEVEMKKEDAGKEKVDAEKPASGAEDGGEGKVKNKDQDDDDDEAPEPEDEFGKKIACFCRVIRIVASFEDWRQGLGLLLQPVPFR